MALSLKYLDKFWHGDLVDLIECEIDEMLVEKARSGMISNTQIESKYQITPEIMGQLQERYIDFDLSCDRETISLVLRPGRYERFVENWVK